MTDIDKPLQLLKKYYGYDSFRKGQEKAINSILNKEDTFVLMPTGGGKSIIYQIPALIFEGITLVVSPLISLMKDQVDTLNSMGISSTYINSTLSSLEINERELGLKEGRYKLLYIAPERLETLERFIEFNALNISFMAIDEAHCVSQWGHDFRPSYRNIPAFINRLSTRPVILACTATATDIVKEDIVHLLNLQNHNSYCTGFNRENLHFKVFRGENKENFILDYISSHIDDVGIIYAATRKTTEHLYSLLSHKGLKCGVYHGGLSEENRKSMQDAFMFDDINIMVATNAFGMGIDKSNVRYVIHYNMPKNLEAYYQEAGRGGRDGEVSECILLFSSGDVQTQKFFIDNSTLPPSIKMQEYNNLRAMVDYCYTSKCLKEYILNYFGEELEDKCNSCSNCNEESQLKDVTTEAMMIFSTIYRVNERFGVNLIIDILKGSRNQRILNLGLDKVSTHGLMSKYHRTFIEEVINKLIAEGYLSTTDEEFPRVILGAKAKNTLKNKNSISLAFRKQFETPSGKTQSNKGLFDELKSFRKSLAEELQVPPYIIFHDTTLKELSEKLPTTQEGFLNIKGIGVGKFEKYGEKFIDVIKNYMETNNLNPDTSKLSPSITPSSTGEKKEKSHIITLNLYNEGHSIKEISKLRGISLNTVQSHIIQCAEEGEDVNLDLLISEGSEDLILDAIKKVGIAKLKPIKEELPENIDYMAIKAVVCKHNLPSD